jgi:LuxR family maltose regulon positive regulatory protein
VARTGLLRRLDEGDDSTVRVVVGSPGSGKTSLLAQWARSIEPADVAWVSVDVADRDPVRFWRAVIASVARVRPGFGAEATDLLTMDGRVDQDALESLLIDADTLEPLTLVIDDLHLALPAVVDDLAALLVRRWAIRLAIGSRSDVVARLGRLQLTGRTIEVREADLRFDEAEALQLVDALVASAPLSADELAVLMDKTEGWAAGLQLGALAMAGQDDREGFLQRMAGTTQVISQYLSAELIDAQPPEVRRFLLATSIVDELSPDLARALDPASTVSIADIEERHLLLVRLDAAGEALRYHHLFADLLRYRLRAEDPGLEALLHERAGRWYREHGDLVAAFRHLWAGGQRTEAMELVHGSVIDAYLAGSQHVVHHVTSVLTDADLRAAPDHALSLASALLLDGRPEQADALAHRVAVLDGALDPLAQVRLHAIRATARFARCDPEATVGHATDALRVADEHEIDDTWVAIAAGVAARARLWTAQPDAAEPFAERLHGAVGPAMLDAADHRSTIALLRLGQGRPNEAAVLATSAVAAVMERADDVSPDIAVLPRTVLGLALLELGELDRATTELQAAADGASALRRPATVAALIGLSRIHHAEGRADAALLVLDRADPLVRAAPLDSPVATRLAARRGAVLVAAGDLERAGTIARSMPEGWCRSHLEATIDLASGRTDAAEARLLGATDGVPLDGRDELDAASLRLQVALARRDPAAVRLAADGVLDLAAPGGCVFAIAEAGASALQAVVDAGRRRPQTEHLRRLQRTRPHAVTSDEPRAEYAIDALSEREQTVLRYLVTAMSYREIAEELYVSVNTVKTHVKNVIRKLHATSRADAIRRARELGYL